MTRLQTRDIAGMASDMAAFDADLVRKTGQTLVGVACHSLGMDPHHTLPIIQKTRVGVIPFTCGLGIISGFSRTVAAILAHAGFQAFVPRATDVAGITESMDCQADLMIMADDHQYAAISMEKKLTVDNAWATGIAFTAALDLMAKGIKGKKVLVTGCGPVGRAAIHRICQWGGLPAVYDPNQGRCRKVAAKLLATHGVPLTVVSDLKNASGPYPCMVEASPGQAVIQAYHIHGDTCVAAPGVPCGVSANARKKLGNRFLYDSLRLGTVTMAIAAAAA